MMFAYSPKARITQILRSRLFLGLNILYRDCEYLGTLTDTEQSSCPVIESQLDVTVSIL